MATIYEVSRLAGVSLATVSRVMNNSGKVSEKTRDLVLQAMKDLNYRPNAIARSLAANRSNCVGILVSELHGPIFGAMVSSIERKLQKNGRIAIFAVGHSDQEKELEGIRFLSDMNCDALILHVEALSDQHLLQMHEAGEVPLVVINRKIEGMEDNCISLDNFSGGYAAAQSLIDLGHRDIAYITGPLNWQDARDRLAGHRQALLDAGIGLNEKLILEGDFHERGGGEATEALLDAGTTFTALACGNDEMAAGAMEVIRRRGLEIPEDISVMGFDNVRWASYLYPQLTSVNYPVAEMGQMAACWVLKNVYGKTEIEIQRHFTPTVVSRNSVGPYRAS